MPLHDFVCAPCHRYAVDVYVPIAVGASHANLVCPDCGGALDWIPQVGAMDAKEPFHQFEVDVAGQRRHVGSLHDIRKIEREAEQRSRNGEGQPLVWRDYSQNRSNFDSHTLAKNPLRSMDTQDGFRGGVTDLPSGGGPVGIARGADVAKRHGEVTG